MRPFCCLILLSLCSGLQAQIPGYLGKRISLEGSFQSIPALNGPTAKNLSFGFGGSEVLALNWRVAAIGAYAISRDRQVYLSAGFFKTGANGANSTDFINPDGSLEYRNYGLFYTLNCKTVSIGTRRFRTNKGAIAPFGRYNGWSLNATFAKGEINASYSSGDPRAVGDLDPQASFWTLGYEFGQNIIVKDFLQLSIGGKLNIPLQFNRYIRNDGFKDNEDWFKQSVFERLALHGLVSFNLGIGFIL